MKSIFTLLIVLSSISLYGQGYNGLIARWPFNGNANDVSGHALHGTVFGATPDTGYNGLPNTAYRFDGINDYIMIGAKMSLSDVNALAMKYVPATDRMNVLLVGDKAKVWNGLQQLGYEVVELDKNGDLISK